ncbi:carboxymuconolactone decarboxylase family protein [Chitinophaga sp.]|uniref:carboxymuconolactone decarboxylase family protein n=1 Tax=Chitinophaga sp. TaxID=1869181 RepID=UPI0031E1CE54
MQRLDITHLFPGIYDAIRGLEKATGDLKITPLQKELIKIRASQLNGCAFCLHMHAELALKYGEAAYRLHLVAVWKEARHLFSEEEQVILELTEQMTLIHQQGLTEEIYSKAIALFGEETTGQVMMSILAINSWNRLGVALHWKPQI